MQNAINFLFIFLSCKTSVYRLFPCGTFLLLQIPWTEFLNVSSGNVIHMHFAQSMLPSLPITTLARSWKPMLTIKVTWNRSPLFTNNNKVTKRLDSRSSRAVTNCSQPAVESHCLPYSGKPLLTYHAVETTACHAVESHLPSKRPDSRSPTCGRVVKGCDKLFTAWSSGTRPPSWCWVAARSKWSNHVSPTQQSVQ